MTDFCMEGRREEGRGEVEETREGDTEGERDASNTHERSEGL